MIRFIFFFFRYEQLVVCNVFFNFSIQKIMFVLNFFKLHLFSTFSNVFCELKTRRVLKKQTAVSHRSICIENLFTPIVYRPLFGESKFIDSYYVADLLKVRFAVCLVKVNTVSKPFKTFY